MKLSTLNERAAVPAFYTWNISLKQVMYRMVITLILGFGAMMSQAQDPPCLVDYTLTADPAPVADTYEAGQTVTFSFEITQWDQINSNWFHGVIVTFGDGWDASSLIATPAASCDGFGEWGYYDESTDVAATYGPGFFYERTGDDDPTNNFGDNCTGGWIFEITLTALEDCPGLDLGLGLNTTGDSETGSWSSGACDADPEVTFAATNICVDNGPENDECDGALEILCDDSVDGSTIDATIDDSAPFCGTSITSPGVWYHFVGDGSNATFSLCGGAAWDTKLSAYSGSCDNLTCVTGLDDFCGLQSEISFDSEDGEDYYILVHGFGGATGDFTLTSSCFESDVPNDDCDGAIALECGDAVEGSTVGATADDVAFCGTSNGTGGGVWYSFLGTGDLITLTTCSPLSNYDTKIRVYTGSCDALECVGGDDDDSCEHGGLLSRVIFPSDAGTEYLILVHGFGSSEGEFELSIDCGECPSNDAPCDAIALDLDVAAEADNTCATADDGEVSPGAGSGISSCNSSDGWCSFETEVQTSVWFTFVAPDCGGVLIEAGYLTLVDWQLAVYSVGDCADYSTFDEVGGNDDGGLGLSPALELAGLTPGETYYIQLDGFAGTIGIDEILVSETGGDIVFTCPDDITIECGDDESPANTGEATAENCDNELLVTFEDDIVDLDCGYEIHRHWFIALQNNFLQQGDDPLSCTQIITVIDTQDPYFTSFPEDFSIECGLVDDEGEMIEYLDANIPFPTYEDACTAVEDILVDVEWEFVGSDECPVAGMCMKHITITDECGNSVTQTLTVTLLDTEGPEFEDYEDPIEVSCLEEVPGPADLMAYDDCMNEYVDVEIFESNTGELTDTCNLSVAFGPGDDWALWLPTLFADGKVSSANFVFDENGGLFEAYNDGTAHLTGTVVNDVNPAEMYELDFWFENKADWDTWSSMGRSYKDDLGCAQPDLYEAWTYYELVNGFSTANGLGDLAGDVLYFYHMPDNYYFGFQIGQGANNKNCDYGMSGWFTYYGFADGMFVDGHGDVNVDADCGEFQDESDCPHDTEFTYFYRAEDDCGNATIVSQTVIVLDEIGPEFTLFPEDITVDCDEYPVEIAEVEAVDNCEGDVTIVGPEDEMFPGDCPNEFEVHRTWGAIDICGNRTDMTQIITVVDDEAPVMAGLPEDVTVECDAIPAIPEVTATDNCSDADAILIEFDEEEIEGDCDGEYTILRTWIATDECDNSSEYTQEITVEDTTAPVFDAYDAEVEMPCDDINYDVVLTAQDNCSDVDVWFEDEMTDTGCAGTILRTYYAEDDCGNQATALVTITLTDDEAPEFDYVQEDMTLECDEDVPAAEASANDNCDDDVTIQVSAEIIDGDCPQEYTMIRTYTAIDNCGNETSATQTITVVDTTAPEFTYVPEGGEYSCDEDLPTEEAEAEDNCGEATVTSSDEMIDGDCENSYTVIRTFTAVDECGNEDSVSITFFIYDDEAPEFTFVQADMTLECDEDVPAPEATAIDNCDGDVTIEVSPEIIDGDCPQEYTMIRTYTATDNCGNSTEATQTITVVDTTAPEFVDYEYYTYVECEDIDDYTLEAVDNCGEVEVEIIHEILNSGGCMGVLYRIYLATDECGNETEVDQYIVITDTTAPELVNVPADETLECSDVSLMDDGNYFDAGDVYGEDNCGLDVEILYSEEVQDDGDDCPESFIIIRTWIGIDYCENETMAQQTVTVVDTTNPWFLEFPQDMVVECSDELPEVVMPEADDNCDDDVEVTVTIETEDGDCEGEQTILRIYRAFDNCGNETMMVQTIEVVDTTAPEFDYVPEAAVYECDEDILEEMATATDNCSTATVTFEDGPSQEGDCPQEYSFVRVFTATDDCGNSAQAEQLISVVDTTAPEFEPYEVNIEMPCDMIDDAITVAANDNCDLDVEITFTDSPVSGGCAGQIIRDYTATDDCGNEAYAQQIITLTDDVAPVFTEAPGDLEVECDDIPDVAEGLEAEDNCDDDVEIEYLGQTIIEGDCPQNYTIVRTWEATDHCGNSVQHVQNILVDDTTDPEFIDVPEDAEYSCEETIELEMAEADDNCGDVTVTHEDIITEGSCINEYTIERVFTATDECGNSATASQIIEVFDNTQPWFTYVPAPLFLECDETPVLEDPIAADNCDGEVIITEFTLTEPGQCENEWTEIRIFTAQDACGNLAAAEQFIFYSDNTAPVFDAYEVDIEMPCDQIDDAILVSATDNCDDDVEITYTDSPVSGGCAGVIIRDYTAVDNCGNESYAQQIITLTDEIDPELAGVPADLTLECGDDIPEPADVTATDNCDDDLEVIFEETEVANDCLYTIVRTWTVTDHCGNMDSATQEITIIDTTDPYFEVEDTEITIDCHTDVIIAIPDAFDICDEDVEVTPSSETIPGDCPNEWTIIHTFTAEDDCGNTAQVTTTVNYVDEIAPDFTYVPQGGEYSCDEDLPTEEAEAEDLCGDVTITSEDEIIDGDCPQSYTLIRHWTATDECGNESEASTEYYIYDDEAPEFDQEVSDLEVECLDEIPEHPVLTATDNCGIAEVAMDVLEDLDECGNGVILVIYTATDECGNASETSFEISIEDETAPVLEGDLPEDLTIDCDADVPAAPVLTATDNCGGDIDVDYSEEIVGDLPAEGSDSDCIAYTGESPYYNPDWSVWLQLFPNGDEFYYTEEASWVTYPDGTAHLTGDVISTSNSEAGWTIDVWFENGMDWDAWSTQDFPTSYKDDFDLAGDHYLDWMYYIVSAGSATLTGTGDYTGSLLNITHAPSNYYYGYQVGIAANNVNGNDGSGGWFYYDGELVEDGVAQEVSGAGDFAFDHDCCPRYEIVRTWCAEDCSGNEVCHTQTITFEDLEEDPAVEDGEENPVTAIKTDMGQDVVDIYPNPMRERAYISFNLEVGGRTNIEIYSMSGSKVMDVYNGETEAGRQYTIEFNVNELASGLYFYRLTNGEKVITDRMIISK